MKELPAFLALLFVSGSPALAFQGGDWVLAQYRGGSYWYPGIVNSNNGQTVTLTYDDGDKETRPVNQVKVYSWRVGSPVECNWRSAGKFYPGRIVGLSGQSLTLVYDQDRVQETTSTGNCRSR